MTKPQIMGIINITPDSFYENSRHHTLNKIVETALTMKNDGADILDIGGESSRPGAAIVSEKEELDRVIPAIEAISQTLKLPISIDTVKPNVAKTAIQAGANLINDISGFENQAMIELAREHDVKICVMHMQGTPQTMQIQPYYKNGIVTYLIEWFKNKCQKLIKLGIDPHKIILDPGIGFGKTLSDNLKIIKNLSQFKELGFPILLGTSRKSFLGKIVDKPAKDLLSATLAINTYAFNSGVDIMRVHDVKEHSDILKVILSLKSIQTEV